MGKINTGRVILGGLLAGLIINIGEYVLNEPILGEEWKAAMESLNRSPFGSSSIAMFVTFGFVLGIAAVWTYAAIRPRFGAGPKTALCAGLLVWFFAYFYVGVSLYGMGLFAPKLVFLPIVWGLIEIPIATAVGGWLYKEA